MFPRFRWRYPGLNKARLLQIAAILCERWMAAFAPKRTITINGYCLSAFCTGVDDF